MRHGGHHVVHRLRKTTLPRRADRRTVRPLTSGSSKSGATKPERERDCTCCSQATATSARTSTPTGKSHRCMSGLARHRPCRRCLLPPLPQLPATHSHQRQTEELRCGQAECHRRVDTYELNEEARARSEHEIPPEDT